MIEQQTFEIAKATGPRKRHRKKNRMAADEFLRRLRHLEGENLLRVTLFGSMARGDDHEESDIDLFILLKHYDENGEEEARIRNKIDGIANSVQDMYRQEVFLSPLIRSESTYLKNRKKSLIYYSIADEGIVLYDKDTQ